MILTFYINIEGHRKLKFNTASGIDSYVRTTKIQPGAMIELYNDDKKIGELLVSKYLQMLKNDNDN